MGDEIGMRVTIVDSLTLKEVVELLGNWQKLLASIERDMTKKRVAKIKWSVTKLSLEEKELAISIRPTEE